MDKTKLTNRINDTTFKNGHIRSKESIKKQIITMKQQIRDGKRTTPTKPKGIKDIYKNIQCRICLNSFVPTSGRQKWCRECIPDKQSRNIYQRYGLDRKQYLELLNDTGMCPICNKRKSSVIDHSHESGKVRGIICNSCNLSLYIVENKEILNKALKYLEGKL
jgi:hypothetical protein